MLNFKKTILLILAVVFATSGFSCKLLPTQTVPTSYTKKTELSYWGVWDNAENLQPIFNDFEKLHPNITIKYRKFRYEEYQQQLLQAWAEDRGPDLYSIPATWINQYLNFITPQPANVKLTFQEVKTTLGKQEITTSLKSVPIFSASDVKNLFADVVYNDVVKKGQIYALPFSLDTLALYYNRDILDKAGIATPPTNWTEVAEAVKKITQLDKNNNVLTSGIALGKGKNINQSADIISLLMMQNGAKMANSNGQAAFDQAGGGKKDYYPGVEAVKFYTDFSDPIKEVYTWDKNMPEALEAFISGKLGMMLNYSYQLPVIKGRAPKLNFGVTAAPQIENAGTDINFTNYWVETVSHKSKNAEMAWGFLNFALSDAEIAKYLKSANKPPVLRPLIVKASADPYLNVFYGQILTGAHWYQGKDSVKADNILKDMLDAFAETPNQLKLLQTTVSKINQTY